MSQGSLFFRRTARAFVMLCALSLTATTAQAQSLIPSATLPVTAREADATVGPRVRHERLARSRALPAGATMIQGSPTRRDVAWMVLGGATLIVGSIVGGDGGTIIMVTGGVIGLVGLWRYLQYS